MSDFALLLVDPSAFELDLELLLASDLLVEFVSFLISDLESFLIPTALETAYIAPAAAPLAAPVITSPAIF